MKTAKEYLKQAKNYTTHYAEQEYDKDKLLNIIKQAQIDAVEYTTKRCAKEANICLRTYNDEIIEEDFGKEVTTEREQEYWGISKQSILNVADKIKKELNNE